MVDDVFKLQRTKKDLVNDSDDDLTDDKKSIGNSSDDQGSCSDKESNSSDSENGSSTTDKESTEADDDDSDDDKKPIDSGSSDDNSNDLIASSLPTGGSEKSIDGSTDTFIELYKRFVCECNKEQKFDLVTMLDELKGRDGISRQSYDTMKKKI